MPSLQTDSVDSMFSQPSFGGGGAFAITLGGGGGSPTKEWPLASCLAVALPAASPPAAAAGNPSKAKSGSSIQRPGRGSTSLAGSPRVPSPLAAAPEPAGAGSSSRSRLRAAAAADSRVYCNLSEAALEAEIWAAEAPAMAAAAAGKPAAATEVPPAAKAAGLEAEEPAAGLEVQDADEVAPQSWLERTGLGFDDAATEAQFVQWHGLQAQKVCRLHITDIVCSLWEVGHARGVLRARVQAGS